MSYIRILFYSKVLVISIAFIIPVFSYGQDCEVSKLDNKHGTSVKPILSDAAPIVSEIEERGMEIVRKEFDLIFDDKQVFRKMYSDWEYGIVAFGDYRIEDIDVSVSKEVDGNWVTLEEDDSSRPKAAVTVEPSYDGLYSIDVEAYEFEKGCKAGSFGVIIFHE